MNKTEQKEWYKSTWGIIVAILFLPIFIIWYVWVKTDIHQGWKIAITAIIGIMFISAVAQQPKKTTTATKPSPVKTTSRVTTPAPVAQIVFDVSSLIGKNIDEVKQVLGQPTDGEYIEPNESQKSLSGFTEWDNTFKKNDEELLITFDYKTRKIKDFFISATNQDKNRLLQIGNLKDNSSDYKIEYVKALKDPSKITGVIITPNK